MVPAAMVGSVRSTAGFLGGSMRCSGAAPMSSPRAAADLSATVPAAPCQARCRLAAPPPAPTASLRQLSPRAALTRRAASHSSLTPAVAASEISRLRRDAAPLLKHTSTLGAAFRKLAEAEALHRRVYGSDSAELLNGLVMCLVNAAAAELQRDAEVSTWYDVAPGLPFSGSLTGRALAAARAGLALDFLERTPMVALSGEASGVLDRLQPTRWGKLQARLPGKF